MDLDQARRVLRCRIPGWRRLREWQAVRWLAATAAPEGVDVLVQTWLVADAARRRRLERVLAGRREPAQVARLWALWGACRAPELGRVLQRLGRETEADEWRDLSVLKLGREAGMPLDLAFAVDLQRFADDPDPEVRAAFERYLARLEAQRPLAYVSLLLQRRDFARLGSARATVDLIASRVGLPELTAAVSDYVAFLPPGPRLYACLRLGWLDRIALTPALVAEFLPLLAATEPAVAAAAGEVLDRQRALAPELWRWFMLKLGRERELGGRAADIAAAVGGFDDADADVRAAAGRFLAALPADAATDEAVFGHWLQHDTAALRTALRDSGRRPPGLPLETLFLLLTHQLERYLQLNDTDGAGFRGAWMLASPAQRQELNAVVRRSHHEGLVRSYELAMSDRADYDLDLHVRALTAAGQDQALWALVARLNLGQFLGVCRRWAASGWRPAQPEDRALVDAAVGLERAWRDAALAAAGAVPLPGTVDVLAAWRAAAAPPAAARPPGEAGPLAWAQAVFVTGAKRPGGESGGWLDRLALALRQPWLAPPAADDVLWVNLASGWVPELRAAPLRGTPDDYDATRELTARLATGAGPLAARLRVLAGLLERLQRHFGTGLEVFDAEASAGPGRGGAAGP